MGKKKEAQKNSTLIPVFRLKPYTNNSGRIKHVGHFDTSEKLLDELVEWEPEEIEGMTHDDFNSKITIFLGNVRGYNISAKMYKCNLTGSFLVDNKELPVYYLSISYEKAIVKGFLMEYYLTFTMDDDCKEKLEAGPKSGYVNAWAYGKYKYGVSINERVSDNYDQLMTELLIEKESSKYTEEELENEETLEAINSEIKERLSDYTELFDAQEHDKVVTVRSVKRQFLKIAKDPRFLDIISIGIKDREKERREEAGMDSDDEFEPPEPSKVICVSNVEETKRRFENVLTL